MVHRFSCSAACGIFPDQGSNPCPLHWQADSQPLRHQGSPDFPSFDDLDSFENNWSGILQNILPLGFVRFFSWLDLGYGSLGGKPQEKCPSRHVLSRYVLSARLSAAVADLDHLAGVLSVRGLCCQVTRPPSPPLSTLCSLEGSYTALPTLKGWGG